MRARTTGLILLVLAVCALPWAASYADRGGGKRLTCPVCSKQVFLPYRNDFPGLGVFVRLDPNVMNLPGHRFSVSTCPNCRYSNWSRHFARGVKAETAKRILAGMEAPTAVDERSKRLPTWAQYELAARVLAWDGRSAADRGSLLLAGSWAIRQETEHLIYRARSDNVIGHRFEHALESAKQEARAAPRSAIGRLVSLDARRESVAAAAEQLATRALPRGEVDSVPWLLAALLQRQLGDVEAVARTLAQIDSANAPQVVREIAERINESMSRERALQEQALPLLIEGLERPAHDADARSWARLCVADSLRRLARAPEAMTHFLEVLKDPEAPAWAVFVVRHGLRRVGADKEHLALLAKAQTRALDAVRQQLMDPKTARQAALFLSNLADTAFHPDLLAALDSKHERVRAMALLALERMDELALPPSLVDALGRLALDRNRSNQIRASALARLEVEATPASLPVFRAVLTEDESGVRQHCVDGLARCGETKDVARLLALLAYDATKLKDGARRGVLLALSCLASRSLASTEEAVAWWASAKDRERMDWVRESFKRAGVTVPAPLSLKSVPDLLRLLDAGERLDRPWVTWNALRALHEITGQRFGWTSHASAWSTKSRRPKTLWNDNRPWIIDWQVWWSAQSAKRTSGK